MTVSFKQDISFIVEAYNVVRAKELALHKARECATESEELQVVDWKLVEEEKR